MYISVCVCAHICLYAQVGKGLLLMKVMQRVSSTQGDFDRSALNKRTIYTEDKQPLKVSLPELTNGFGKSLEAEDWSHEAPGKHGGSGMHWG